MARGFHLPHFLLPLTCAVVSGTVVALLASTTMQLLIADPSDRPTANGAPPETQLRVERVNAVAQFQLEKAPAARPVAQPPTPTSAPAPGTATAVPRETAPVPVASQEVPHTPAQPDRVAEAPPPEPAAQAPAEMQEAAP